MCGVLLVNRYLQAYLDYDGCIQLTRIYADGMGGSITVPIRQSHSAEEIASRLRMLADTLSKPDQICPVADQKQANLDHDSTKPAIESHQSGDIPTGSDPKIQGEAGDRGGDIRPADVIDEFCAEFVANTESESTVNSAGDVWDTIFKEDSTADRTGMANGLLLIDIHRMLKRAGY